jgi:hypothetical protein
MEEQFDLGMNFYGIIGTDLPNYLEILLNNNFTYIRPSMPTYTGPETYKPNVLACVAAGFKVIWGVCGWALTAANWNDYRLAVLDAAQWCQDNGVYEFQIGNEEEGHIDGTTLTLNQLIINLKSLATEAKSIFTNGKVSYACPGFYIPDWVSAGKGDLDFLTANVYMGGTTFNENWKTRVKSLIDTFGVDGAYLTEFSLSYLNLNNYSTDENVQLNGIIEMLKYIQELGIKRALFFSHNSDEFGALKNNGVYRKLWDVLKIQNDWKRRKTAGQANIRGLSHG